MDEKPPIKLLNRPEAAAYLNISPNTLAVWATQTPMKIPMVKIGSRVMYRQSDLDAYIDQQTMGG